MSMRVSMVYVTLEHLAYFILHEFTFKLIAEPTLLMINTADLLGLADSVSVHWLGNRHHSFVYLRSAVNQCDL